MWRIAGRIEFHLPGPVETSFDVGPCVNRYISAKGASWLANLLVAAGTGLEHERHVLSSFFAFGSRWTPSKRVRQARGQTSYCAG